MSGTLFIVCIPTSEKEKIWEKDDVRRSCRAHAEQEEQGTTDRHDVSVAIENIADSTKHDSSIERIKVNSTPKLTKSSEDIKSRECSLKIDIKKIRKSLGDIKFRLTNSAEPAISPTDSNEFQLNISPGSSMEVVLTRIFRKLKIENVAWQKCTESFNVTFSLPNGDLHHEVLNFFKYWGIGERRGSSVTMVPCTVLLPTSSFTGDDVFTEELSAKQKGMWNGFMNSVRARWNIANIVEELRQNASLTFDFVTLIVIAGIMAAFGLIENSIICLTSSMLISPLMGPLIAATFSTVIKDSQLMKFGVINELIGICLATLVGFVFGLIVGSVDEKYGVGDGLGEEILSRCEIHSLIIGAFTAIPSGAAVAIAILSESIGPLVGVAISASILPPAVNAGLLWALAVLFMIHEKDANVYNSVIKSTLYSDHQAVELAILGAFSMAVTIINVVCIYGTGVLFLKIKEVAPMISKSEQQFWKHDVKLARDYNKTIGTTDGAALQNKLFEELAQFRERDFTTEEWSRAGMFSNQNTWSPMMRTRNTRIPIQELDNLYWNPSHTDQSRSTKRLGCIALRKSLSPPQYKQLKNNKTASDFNFSISLLNHARPSSSTTLPQQMHCDVREFADSSKITETPCRRTVIAESNKAGPSKSKFVVTPASIDPLDYNKSLL